MIAGVAGGVAQHLGLDPIIVRVAFVVLSLALGFGVVVYALLWVLAPAEVVGSAAPAAPRQLPRPSTREILGGGLLVGGVFVILWVSGIRFSETVAWPVTIAAIGFAILWARGSAEEGRGRLDLASIGTPLEALLRNPVSRPRFLAGGALIVGGMVVLLAATTTLEAAANVVLAVIVTAGGLALLADPGCGVSPTTSSRSGAAASAPRPGRRWRPISTIPSCRRWPSSSARTSRARW
jgi:phage shock protein PspC (stress-responsive transcriptional regulator)